MALSAFQSVFRVKAILPSIGSTFRGIHSIVSQHATLFPRLYLPCNSVFEQRRHYAMRLELTEHGIIWRRPAYIPSWKAEKSGDLEPLKKPDSSRPPIKLLAAKDVFDELDEETKRYLSLESQPRRESMKVTRYDSLRKIQRHRFDTGSMECAIAMMTCKIRNLQEVLPKLKKKEVTVKVRLDELIAQRKKKLKHLRRMDYKRFEWLIDALNIEYKPFPKEYHWITRKDSLRKLVQLHKEDVKTKRLEEYRDALKIQKELFIKEKSETQEWIAKAEAELKIPIPRKSSHSGKGSY